MFIRYNQAAKYYEYDTSAAQNGSGPWAILPLDGNISGGFPTNVAYIDRTNTFVAWQRIVNGSYPIFMFTLASGGVDRKNWRLENFEHFYISSTNDADNAYQQRFVFGRDGGLTVPAFINAGGNITGNRIIGNFDVVAAGNQGPLKSYDPNGPANNRQWTFLQPNNGVLYLQTQDDGGTGQSNVLYFGRDGIVTFSNYTIHPSGAYFPNLSSNAGLLDRYEEGAWTPILYSTGGGGGTGYATQDGRYTRIGQIITVHYSVQVTAANWADGYLQLGGLPYPSSEMYTQGGMDYWYTTTNFYDMKTHLPPNATSCYFIGRSQPTTTGHDLVISVPYYQTGNVWRGSFTYRTTT